MEQFPGNSKHRPSGRDEPKEVKRIVQGEVVRRKTPLGRRVTKNLIGGDAQSVWGYVSGDILAPAFRDLIEDAFVGFITRMVRGDDARYVGRSRGRSGSGHTAYNRYHSSSRGHRDEPPREMSRRGRATHSFDEIILTSRVEGEEALNALDHLISQYDSASVADLYGLLGISASYTDDKWGWTDIRGANVSRVHGRGGGYLLNLPKPEPID